ncbi:MULTISPECIES: hypothetical protein [Streptomyces]|uniref:hypothetical protein n=1 Tax=Streptomyces TaxID=1883 RepID=UPI000583A61D|nr:MULTISPECIES: hypothetical protein [Streptomyces]MCH0557303.1 hypothetical protein [Streptomyces sp. MUM 16J]
MPQEAAARAQRRGTVIALLVGLVLALTAHAFSCVAHLSGSHGCAGTVAAAATPHQESVVQTLPSMGQTRHGAPAQGAGHRPGHGAPCCDPGGWPAEARSTAGVLLLLLLTALHFLGSRSTGPMRSGTYRRRHGGSVGVVPAGARLLRLVCVSRV